MIHPLKNTVTVLGLALGLVALLAAPSLAGTHYAFVKFEANGTTAQAKEIGGGDLARAEWIQCKRVSYGLKRDIGTGARVSGHTHYDRIEFDVPQGPATPMLRAGEASRPIKVTVGYFTDATRSGKPALALHRAGVLVASARTEDGRVKLTVDVETTLDADLVERARTLTTADAEPTPVRAE